MKSFNIPDNVLDTVIGETYEGDYTLRDELDNIPEPVVFATWELKPFHFIGWTDSFVLKSVEGPFGDIFITKVDRNPPC